MFWAAPGARPAIIGHRGARGILPENTLPSIEAAIASGVDAIEFDVRRGADGQLVLAHRRSDARRGRPLRLEEALSFLAEPDRSEIGIVADVKQYGIEADLVSALRRAGVIDRSMACGREVDLLRRLGEADPSLRRAWSLKRARHAAAARLGPARRDVAGAAAAALEAELAELVTVHRSLVTARLVEAVHEAAGQVLVWGVDSNSRGGELAELGVDALIVDDPRRFRAPLGTA